LNVAQAFEVALDLGHFQRQIPIGLHEFTLYELRADFRLLVGKKLGLFVNRVYSLDQTHADCVHCPKIFVDLE
jgi:hypothetical protein